MSRASSKIVDDPQCVLRLLDQLKWHPRSDLLYLCKALSPWSKQTLCEMLNKLTREWRVCWRMERPVPSKGHRRARRVYWLAPADLAQRADPATAAARVSKAIRPGLGATATVVHTGTPASRAGRIQVLAVAGPTIAEDGRRL